MLVLGLEQVQWTLVVAPPKSLLQLARKGLHVILHQRWLLTGRRCKVELPSDSHQALVSNFNQRASIVQVKQLAGLHENVTDGQVEIKVKLVGNFADGNNVQNISSNLEIETGLPIPHVLARACDQLGVPSKGSLNEIADQYLSIMRST